MHIRLATLADLNDIMQVIDDAKELLRNSNSLQWNGSDGYPNVQTFINDINNGICYIACDEDKIVGTVSIQKEKDLNYEAVPNIWNFTTYYSIHRIAVKKEYYHKGVAPLLIEFSESFAKENNIDSIRVDTHEINKPMRRLLEKSNYVHVGTIYLLRTNIDNERLAFEKKL